MARKQLIFISGPYTIGDVVDNIRYIVAAAEIIKSRGALPFVPHLFHLWHLISPHEYEYWTEMDLEIIRHCQGILRIPGESRGADKEVEFALSLNIPVYDLVEDIMLVNRTFCEIEEEGEKGE
jgi:hypothetical protein